MPRQKATETANPTPEQLALWTRRFATLIKIGVSLVRSMAVLEEDLTNGPLCDVTRRMREAVQGGQTLVQAMQAFPNVFDEDYLGSVRTGELGGILDVTLLRWADVLERRIPFVAREAELPSRGQLAEWCWRLGHLWGAGVPTLNATEALAEWVCRPLRAVSTEIDSEVRVGGTLSLVMQRHPELFPSVLLQMMWIAELSGDMSAMLEEAAAHFDREAAYEAAGMLPPLWSKESGQESERRPGTITQEHPVVRKVNGILAAACRRGAQAIDVRPETKDRGTAELTVNQKPDQKISIEEYDRVARRLRILAGIDPFTREVRTGPIHIRWEGKDFSGHVTSRPSAAGDRLFVTLRPAAVLEAEDQPADASQQ